MLFFEKVFFSGFLFHVRAGKQERQRLISRTKQNLYIFFFFYKTNSFFCANFKKTKTNCQRGTEGSFYSLSPPKWYPKLSFFLELLTQISQNFFANILTQNSPHFLSFGCLTSCLCQLVVNWLKGVHLSSKTLSLFLSLPSLSFFLSFFLSFLSSFSSGIVF